VSITDENGAEAFIRRPGERDSMPAISITDEQRERLRWVQRRLGDDIEYGHVRPRDAVEYLLDRFDEDDDAPAATAAAEPVAGTTETTEPTGTTETTGTTGTAETVVVRSPDAVDSADTDDPSGSSDAGAVADEDGDGDGDTDSDSDGDTDSDSDGDTDSDSDSDEGDVAAESADGGGITVGEASSGATLNSMMSLLADHDEKWFEASGGEEKYEVDLPDGTTERARTKDDVRALLFKHYR
jgi:hypothetical protein